MFQVPLSRDIFSVVNILLEHNIPHNLVILWGTPFDGAPTAQVVKTILIPRKPHYGRPLPLPQYAAMVTYLPADV